VSGGFYRLVDDYAFGRIDRPHPGSTMELLKTGVDLYELSPTRIQHNKRLSCSLEPRLAACTPRPRSSIDRQS
jgi:hypothetical protein